MVLEHFYRKFHSQKQKFRSELEIRAQLENLIPYSVDLLDGFHTLESSRAPPPYLQIQEVFKNYLLVKTHISVF